MITELRVHGVSGSPAESTLDRPLLRRVAGDGEAGFHRPRPEYGNSTGPGGAQLEAYRWGNLTAGAAARAMWLTLLPFMLANVAMWLRPATSRGGARLIRALYRIFALSLTATLILAMVGITVDLVGWQCAVPASRCIAGRSWLTILPDATGQRLVVLSLVPILLFGVLWLVSSRTWGRYESFPLPPETADGDGLSAHGFWAGKAAVGRLRTLHVTVAYATATAVLSTVLAAHDRTWPGYALAAGSFGLLAACVVCVCLNGMMSRDRPAGWAEGVAGGLRTVALILVALTFVYGWWPRDEWPTSGGLPGYGMAVTLLFAGQMGLLVLIALVTLIQYGRRRRPFLAGLAGPVVASIGLGVAVAFTAGVSYRVADILDRTGTPSPAVHDGQTLQPPPSFEWAALGFVVLVLLVLVVVLVARFTVMRRLRAGAEKVTDTDFPGGRSRDAGRAASIDATIANSRITDHSGPLIGLVFVPLAVAAAVVTGLALAGKGPVDLAPSGSWAADVLSFTTNLGTYLIGIAAIALVVLGLLAYRYSGIRRIVGVLWDLGTFWPRAVHPLAPPCYAERVVPELVTRASWLADRGGVILSGHSQGSVLAAAAVLQLPARVLPRVALLTYGSPLGRLYGRLFPAYFAADVLKSIVDSVGGRWWNLWRDTDPIGGPVGGPVAPYDRRLKDPAAFDVPDGNTVPPPIEGHGGYQTSAGFEEVAADLVSRLDGRGRLDG